MKLSKQDIDKILDNYDIGALVSVGKIKKDDSVSLGFTIKTTKGKYFIKVLKLFNQEIKQGFEISNALRKRNFPTYQIYKTKEGEIFFEYKKRKIIILEFIPSLKQKWKSLNLKEIKSFGKTLAKFHKETKTIKIKPSRSGTYKDIRLLIDRFYKKRKMFSKEIQKILEFMREEIRALPSPKKQYSTGFFSEFNPGHVKFKDKKVSCVIDWEIGREEAWYDIGGSLTACFSKNGKRFSWEKFEAFVEGYESERKLTKWERMYLRDALKFGILKYGIWEFIDLRTGDLVKKESEIYTDELNKIGWMMKTLK